MRSLQVRWALAIGFACLGIWAAGLSAADSTKSWQTSDPNGQHDEALRDLIAQFREQRTEMLQLRLQLIEQLRAASAEQRQAIIEAFRATYREQMIGERELRRDYRRQVRLIRQNRRSPQGSGGE